ncbi:MAG: hypothetical protein GX654_01090 [Desulfatiglans sp.]|jgi:hypothetical protein|nr:hypothetical protein [Desulfatiglans sp.]
MKSLKCLIIFFLFFTISTAVTAAQLSGTVTNVSNLDVTIKVDGGLVPVKGDTLEIFFTLPDGESLSIGTWVITQVTGNIAQASVKENTGNPVTGQRAVISSENPSAMSVPGKKEDVASASFSTGSVYDQSGGIEQIISQLRSSNPIQKRDGAKIAYRIFYGDASIAAIAAEELEKGYMINHRDRHHVDAMAWLCNILGASNNKEYRPFLKKVYKNTKSDKINDYAKKNYKLLK